MLAAGTLRLLWDKFVGWRSWTRRPVNTATTERGHSAVCVTVSDLKDYPFFYGICAGCHFQSRDSEYEALCSNYYKIQGGE